MSSWANNGVLLLNTALTVRAGEAGSHSNRGWEQFTDKVVDVVDKYGGANLTLPDTTTKAGISNGVVFLAWGNWAAKRVARLSKVYIVYPFSGTLSHSLTDKTSDIT